MASVRRRAAWVLLAVSLLGVAHMARAAGVVTEAHTGTGKGTVYEVTPETYAPTAPVSDAAAGVAPARDETGAVAPSVSSGDGGSAPREAGAGVEIISGGGSSAGAARVGRMPVLQ